MEASEILQTFAEVGIGLAGFTGIIAAVQSGRAEMNHEQRSVYTHMIVYSVAIVLYSFLPLILMLAIQPSLAWRLASGTFLATLVFHFVWYWRPGSSVRARNVTELPGAIVYVCAIVGLAGATANIWSTDAAFAYLAALFIFLAFSLFNFVMLLSGRTFAAQQSAAADSAQG